MEVGLFVDMAEGAYFGQPVRDASNKTQDNLAYCTVQDGSVKLKRPNQTETLIAPPARRT